MEETDNPITGARPPIVGVLSQTLVRSPIINWIIPARIRHKDKNDVLFIHHNWLEILELLRDEELETSRLETITFKADFGSPIRSARVLGAVRKSAAPVDTNLDDGIDAIIKQEVPESMDTRSDAPQEIPPQILVLALDSNILVFLFAMQDGVDDVRFISCQRPLPVKGRHAEQLGKHIAVDPK